MRSAIQVLLCQATGSAEDHVCAAPVPGRVSCAHSFERLLVRAARDQPALVVPDRRALDRARAMHVPEHGQLHVLKSHVRSAPVGPVARLALVALGRAGRRERRLGREVRLAEKRGLVAGARQRAREPALADRGIEIDAVVPDAVRERQQPGQYRGARRLAHEVGRDVRGEARALAGEPIEMRRADAGILEAVAVGALLVGGDQQDVGAWHVHVSARGELW